MISDEDFDNLEWEHRKATDLVKELDGYTIATGILNSNLNGDDIVSIPLDVEDMIDIVYIRHEKANLSKMGERFIDYLLEEVQFDN